MRITVDRSAKSNAAPAAAPPKGAVRPALHACGRSVGRGGSHTPTGVWVNLELSSHGRAPTQAAAGTCLLSPRGEWEARVHCMNEARTHDVTVGVAARHPDGTRAVTRERAARGRARRAQQGMEAPPASST